MKCGGRRLIGAPTTAGAAPPPAMRATSASTFIADPYRAGLSLGEALAPAAPEVVVVFSSVHYAAGGELLEGLHDGLGSRDAVVVGNTGDGFYETRRAGNAGAAALGIETGGAVRWRVAQASGARADSRACLRTALGRLDEAASGEKPRFALLLASLEADGSLIEDVLERELDGVPVVGGLAGDDYRFERSYLYCGRQVLQDSVVLLAAYGELAVDISVGNTIQPVGTPGAIDRATGPRIEAIGGLSAMDFFRRETGKPALQTDRGVVALSVVDPKNPELKRLRSVIPESETGAFRVFGSIAEGTLVQACMATPEDLVREVYAIAEMARTRFTPAAALVVSCAGRKDLLAGQVDHEVRALSEAFPEGLPIVGFPSFGELGPLRDRQGRLHNFFHNMTYVLLLLGDEG